MYALTITCKRYDRSKSTTHYIVDHWAEAQKIIKDTLDLATPLRKPEAKEAYAKENYQTIMVDAKKNGETREYHEAYDRNSRLDFELSVATFY